MRKSQPRKRDVTTFTRDVTTTAHNDVTMTFRRHDQTGWRINGKVDVRNRNRDVTTYLVYDVTIIYDDVRVNGLLVAAETPGLGESPPAVGADVGFFPRVNPVVLVVAASGGEFFVAHVTGESAQVVVHLL